MNLLVTGGASQTALLESQRRVLERIASGAPLAESMDTLMRLIEQHADGMRCSLFLADSAQERLTFIAGSSLPADYVRGMEPYTRIAANMGPCGTAAYLRRPVYIEDTAKDPRAKDIRDLALRHGLRAIWSTPVLGDDNEVLGAFAMLYSEPRLPSPEHIQLIDMAVQMARVAIEAKRDQDTLQRREETLRRSRALLLAEAQRISRLLGGADSAHSFDREKTATGAALPVVTSDRRMLLERDAIESLTANERAIFRLITEGKGNAEVGERLHLSPRTVETYRGRMMQKLQVEDMTALVKLAIRHGITGVD